MAMATHTPQEAQLVSIFLSVLFCKKKRSLVSLLVRPKKEFCILFCSLVCFVLFFLFLTRLPPRLANEFIHPPPRCCGAAGALANEFIHPPPRTLGRGGRGRTRRSLC
jgi:hypothetical protein